LRLLRLLRLVLWQVLDGKLQKGRQLSSQSTQLELERMELLTQPSASPNLASSWANLCTVLLLELSY
jgi:hypothetical protein